MFSVGHLLDPRLEQLGLWGVRYELPIGVWGGAPDANDFTAI